MVQFGHIVDSPLASMCFECSGNSTLQFGQIFSSTIFCPSEKGAISVSREFICLGTRDEFRYSSKRLNPAWIP